MVSVFTLHRFSRFSYPVTLLRLFFTDRVFGWLVSVDMERLFEAVKAFLPKVLLRRSFCSW